MPDPNLFDSIKNSILSESILSALTPTAIHKFSLTCRTANESVASYRRCAWNIDNRLSRFFRDPLAFRSLQARTDTIISGAFASEFFSRDFCIRTPLDIFTPLEHFVEVGRWLLRDEVGYTFQHSKLQPCADFEVNARILKERRRDIVFMENVVDEFIGVSGEFNFFRSNADGSEVHVRMAVTDSSTFKVIFNSPSTCFMNLIAFDKAYTLYPKATYDEYTALVTAHGEGFHKVVNRSCEKRGWKMEQDADPRFFPRTHRWIGDKDCWTISLPLYGVEIPNQVLPVDLNGWSLSPTRRETDLGLPTKDWRARCIILRSPVLRLKYALPKTSFWVDFMSQWRHVPSVSITGEIIYEDAAVRTHVGFCKGFSNKVDAALEDEQQSHHRTLMAYNDELKVLQRKMEESENRIANKNGGLEHKLHIMEERVDGVTERMFGFVTEVAQWVKEGQKPEQFDEIVRRFSTVEEITNREGSDPVTD